MARDTTTDLAVLERLLAPAGRDVLDVGCGPGHLVRALAGLGARPVGLEISEQQLAAARAAARAADDAASAGEGGVEGGPVRYVVGRAEALPLPDASMDAVVFLRSLHHVPVAEQFPALVEATRVLRPGGQVYVAEPLPEGSYFELMSLVEDEREVRAAAQLAVGEAGHAGLTAEHRVEYEVLSRVADLEALRRRIVTVDPDRAELFEARRDEIAAMLERAGEPDPEGGFIFRQPMRADLLRHDANAPGVA